VVELKKVSFAIDIITLNKWSMVGRASRQRGLESRVVWRLNVRTREVAAGRNLNDGSFTLHSNLITTTWWARMWKVRKKSLSTVWRHTGTVEIQLHSFITSALSGDEW
jgi:hypothetical protein